MAIKFTINGGEVKNPLVKLLIPLVGLIIFGFLFFIVLPLIWFWFITVILSMVGLVIAAPKFVSQYKIVMRGKQDLEKDTSLAHPRKIDADKYN